MKAEIYTLVRFPINVFLVDFYCVTSADNICFIWLGLVDDFRTLAILNTIILR